MANKLASETSPYLLQHADNPVEWYPWGEAALELARKLDKPILLSIGYSACHWCHVMAHESFEDSGVASIMNENFVNIKVDREERPDLDQIYQTAHGMLSQRSGGWPLTVFLTPQQEPFFSGTYFPKTPRYQLPGFGDLLLGIAEFYRKRKGDLVDQNRQLMKAFASTTPSPNTVVTANFKTIHEAFEELKSSFDFKHGGFGNAPKFPNPSDINFLLRRAYFGNHEAGEMASKTLESMALGGIFDQIGGGFCRYSVDERWNIPHFEKMLYDNGQLLCLYADAYQITSNILFSEVIFSTISWLLREMLSEQGAFYSSLDADSKDENGHNEEGAFYVWQPEQVKKLLTEEEFIVASQVYGFERAPNFESQSWHPYIAKAVFQEDMPLLINAREKLFIARQERPYPGLDDKILTAWNALVIKGIARSGRILNRMDWVKTAQNAMDFIYDRLWTGEGLLATCRGDVAHIKAYLDDYAYLLDALLELMQSDFRSRDLRFAKEIAEKLLRDFESEKGGFYFTSHDHEVLIHRPKTAFDNATPNGNGIATLCLQRLGHLIGEMRYLDSAERSLKAFDKVLISRGAGCPNMLVALEEYKTPPTIIIIRGDKEGLKDWQERTRMFFCPDTLILPIESSINDLPAVLNRIPKQNVNAWVCQGVECSPPINNVDELIERLS